jgi:hypothetical protein
MSIHPEDANRPVTEIPRDTVYNELHAVTIDPRTKTTRDTRHQADVLFARIQQSVHFRSSKLPEKREFFRQLFHAAKRAMYHGGCIRYSRDLHRPDCSKLRLQVIDAAVDMGLFLEHRSPPGSPKMSRLLALSPVQQHASYDPLDFDNECKNVFVELRKRLTKEQRKRKTKEQLFVDFSLPIPYETQERLKLINRTNCLYDITYSPYDQWNNGFEPDSKQLRPIHVAVFTNDFEHHGRLYTGTYGHQSLRKIERSTIKFDQEPSVELDYSGMHTRLLYHLKDIPYDENPYLLWGDKTTNPMRLMAKTLINAAINAKSEVKAISACNQAMFYKNKSGKEREKAYMLYQAHRQTGLTFKDIYARAVAQHHRIADYFGSDYGIVLMRMDSSIAIDVLYHFAKQCIPCLGVHDSFLVPRSAATELKRVMHEFYLLRTGHLPVVH